VVAREGRAEKEHHVFARLRLVGRRSKSASREVALRLAGVAARESFQYAATLRDKGLVAYALAHSPAWTNQLPIADVRGRAANGRYDAQPPVSALHDVRIAQPPAPTSEPSMKGGPMWHTSAVPR
jgi:hypothetical protein